MGEGGYGVSLLGVAGARPAVADVVVQFQPGDGRDGGIAVEVVVAVLYFYDLLIHRLLAVAKTVVGICPEVVATSSRPTCATSSTRR